MNKFLLLFVVIFSYAYAEGESSESSEEKLKTLAAVVENKFNSTIIRDFIVLSEKTKKQCPDLEEKLSSTADEVATCINNIGLGDDTLCALVRNNLEKCAEPVKKMLVGCLPEESKGLPVMAIKIVKAILDEACNSTVEQVLEWFNPCMTKTSFASYEACTKLKNVFTEHKDKLPSKSLVCTTIPNVKSCAESHKEASCKNPVTKAAINNFYETIDSATTAECQDLNKTK